MSEPKKKRDEDEVTIARSIFDEIVEDTERDEKPAFKLPITANRSLDQNEPDSNQDTTRRNE